METVRNAYWWAIGFVEAHPHVTFIYTASLTVWAAFNGGTAIIGGAGALAWAGAQWVIQWAS